MTYEGYIKFNCIWIEEEPFDTDIISDLNSWRQKLYNSQFIGAYPDGISYGNISCRLVDDTFLITGTATGGIEKLTNDHFSRVSDFNIADNTITCHGPIKASSESMTHAIIYKSLPLTNAVVHIHNKNLWFELFNKVPTTSLQAAYGTPEMASEIERLLATTNLQEDKILVMAAHQDGLISFGENMAEAVGKFL